MNLDELAATRRSVRHYKNSGLSETEIRAKIGEILDFVRVNSPSWKNSQTHRYHVALSAEKIEAVRGALPERNRGKCENAVAVIVTSFVKDTAGFSEENGVRKPDNEFGNLWGAYDLGLSDSLLILKAREIGLDTLIMGLRDSDALRSVLSVPENECVCSVISVGIREGDVPAPQRKPLEEIAQFV